MLRENRRVVLKARATALPTPDLFELVVDAAVEPGEGEVLVHNVYVTADPGMKGWISVAKNYTSVEVGETMRSFGVGEVVASRSPKFAVGDHVVGFTGWQAYAVCSADDPRLRKVDPADGPLAAHLGVLGISGMTAYFGLLDVGRPEAGETVLVSTAAGAVGSAVGQIAAIQGCRTVGIAGGPTKTALCREVFGYDAAVDYKAVDDLEGTLREACPQGVDVYFDNVGGAMLDTVLDLMNQNGRVVVCGTAATESWMPPPTGLRVERNVLIKRLRMQGFVIFDYENRYEEALIPLRQWVREKRLRHREDIAEGLEAAPAALAGLYEGRNTGRQLIRIRHEPTS